MTVQPSSPTVSTMLATPPRISVVMPCFNASATLREAIQSILDQSFRDFEFLIIDDGSRDETPEIIRRFRDPRIRVICNPGNLGVIRSLNIGIDMARGYYIARMDADDIALPERFAMQLRFLDAHPDVALCGTAMETFGARTEKWPVTCVPERLKCELLFNSVMYHPTVILRRSVLLRHGLCYDPDFPHAEDYALWTRIADVSRISNLPDVLLLYRLHPESVSQTNATIQQATADRIRRSQLAKLGIEPGERQMKIHTTLRRGAPHTLDLAVDECENWLTTLLAANRRKAYLDPEAFSAVVYEIWFKLCRAHRVKPRNVTMRFLRSPVVREISWITRMVDAVRLLG